MTSSGWSVNLRSFGRYLYLRKAAHQAMYYHCDINLVLVVEKHELTKKIEI